MGLKDTMTMQEAQKMKEQLEQVFLLFACWTERYWKQERESNLHASVIPYGVRASSVVIVFPEKHCKKNARKQK